jgi:hypothetical protein
VNASSNVGTQSTGDFLDDTKAALTSFPVGLILDKVKGGLNASKAVKGYTGKFFTAVKGWSDPPTSVDRKPVQIAASVAVAIADVDVTARIGDAALATQTLVSAGGFISVKATDSYRPDVSATSRTIGDSDDITNDRSSKIAGTADVGVSVAIAIGIYNHDTNAYIRGSATVNAGGAIHVTATTLNAIDGTKLFGANLVAPFLEANDKPDYTTTSGTQVLNGGDVIGLASDYSHGGTGGLTYRYIGPDGASINLGTEDYSNKLQWEEFSLSTNAGLTFFRTLTTYLGDNFSLDDNLANMYSQASAAGQVTASIAGSLGASQLVGIGASVATNQVTRQTEALLGSIGDGTTVLSGGSITSGGSVSVDAKNKGFIGSFAIAGAASTASPTPQAKGSAGAAMALGINSVDDTVRGDIRDATATAAGNVTLNANETPTVEAFTIGGAFSSGKLGGSTAVAGAVSWNTVDAKVEAFIQNQFGVRQVKANGGNIALTANDDSKVYSEAGAASFAWADARGANSRSIGISIANNDVNLGNGDGVRTYIDKATVNATGDVTLQSKDSSDFLALTITGGGAASSGFSFGSTSVAIGGAISINTSGGVVEALVQDGSTVIATGNVSLAADDESHLATIAGAGQGAGAAGGIGGAKSIAIGAAQSVNVITKTVRAKVTDSSVQAGNNATATASLKAGVTVTSFGLAGGGSASASTSLALIGAGSGAVNVITNMVDAEFDNSQVAAAGTASVAATDTSSVVVLAGSAAGGGASGAVSGSVAAVGASLIVNVISDTITADMSNANVNALNVTIGATSQPTIVAAAIGFAGGGAAGATGGTAVAVAGAGIVNSITNTILAAIEGGHVTTTSGQVSLSALDDSNIVAVAGAAAGSGAGGGSGTAVAVQAGASFVINTIANSVRAVIESGAVVLAGGNVALNADDDPDLTIVSIGLAGGGSGGTGPAVQISAAGSGSGNEIHGTIEASVDGSTVTTGGKLIATATDQSDILVVAGGISGCGAGSSEIAVAGAIGLSVATNSVANQVLAIVDGSTVTAPIGVDLTASEEARIRALTIGGALSGAVGTTLAVGVAVGGAGSGNDIGNTVEAQIRGASQISSTAGELTLLARDTSTITAISIGAALSLSSGQTSAAVSIGVSVADNEIHNTILASIENSAVTGNSTPVSIQSTDSATIKSVAVAATLAIAGGNGNSVAVSGGGAGSQNVIRTNTDATIDGSTFSGVGNVAVDASTTANVHAVVTDVAGALGIGSNGAVGVAVEIGVARNLIGYGVVDNVGANQTSHDHVTSMTYGETVKVLDGPLKGDVFRFIGTNQTNSGGIDLSTQDYGDARIWDQVNVTAVRSGVHASVSGSQISSNGALTVDAESHAAIGSTVVSVALAIAGGQGTSVGVGVGGAFTENKINNDVAAYVDGTGDQTISAQSALVSANDASQIDAAAGAGVISGAFGNNGGVAVAVGLGIALNEISGNVSAYVVNAKHFTTTTGDLQVTSESNDTINSTAVAVTISASFGKGGIAFAGAGAASVNVDLSQTKADIENSHINSAGNVSVQARNDSHLASTVVMTSAALAIGNNFALGVSLGAAAAQNFIGYTASGDRVGAGVQAFVHNSSITAGGDLTVNAISNGQVDAQVGAGSAAIAVAANFTGLTIAVSGAGTGTANRIGYDVKAYIDGDDTGISAKTVKVNAEDDSKIDAETGSVSVAANVALFGGSASIGTSVSTNLIDNLVQASIQNADNLSTTSNYVFVTSQETALITSHTFSGAGALAVSIGGAGASVTTTASNTLTDDVEACIADSNILSALGTVVTATDVSTSDAKDLAVAAAAGIFGLALGISLATNTIGGTVAADHGNRD